MFFFLVGEEWGGKGVDLEGFVFSIGRGLQNVGILHGHRTVSNFLAPSIACCLC